MNRRSLSLQGGTALLFLLLSAVISGSIRAEPSLQTCEVPGDYSTVATAVSDAACEIIEVGEGQFRANLVIDRDLTIKGRGAGETILDGKRAGRVLDIAAGSAVTLHDLSIANGLTPFQQGTGIRDHGAGIRIAGGTLLLDGVHVLDNEGGSGAGIHALNSNLTIENSTISSNLSAPYNAYQGGGGIFIDKGSIVSISASTINDNHSLERGGGIRIADGTLEISESTFANNAAGQGGAIESSRIFDDPPAAVTIADSSFTSNSAEGAPYHGAAIYNGHEAVMTIRDTVFSGNQGWASNLANDGQLTLEGCEVSDNAGDAVFNGYNGAMTISQSRIEETHTGERGGYGYGTGVLNQGILIIQETILQRNHSSDYGGAIYNSRSLTVIDSVFKDNESYGYASDIYSNGEGDVLIQNCAFLRTGPGITTVQANIANVYTTMTIEGSSIMNRGQNFGWAITNNAGKVHLSNSTISHITSAYGGVIFNDGQGLFLLSSSTIDSRHNGTGEGNTLDSGDNSDPEFEIVNSIIRSRGLKDCGGYFAFTSLGHNVFSDDSCDSVSSDLTSTQVQLFPHLYNDGSSLVYWLLQGSAAIDAGRDDLCPGVDQLGTVRPLDGDDDGSASCDIGAYEFDPANPPQIARTFLPTVMAK